MKTLNTKLQAESNSLKAQAIEWQKSSEDLKNSIINALVTAAFQEIEFDSEEFQAKFEVLISMKPKSIKRKSLKDFSSYLADIPEYLKYQKFKEQEVKKTKIVKWAIQIQYRVAKFLRL